MWVLELDSAEAVYTLSRLCPFFLDLLLVWEVGQGAGI